jgi:hypothetical protein
VAAATICSFGSAWLKLRVGFDNLPMNSSSMRFRHFLFVIDMRTCSQILCRALPLRSTSASCLLSGERCADGAVSHEFPYFRLAGSDSSAWTPCDYDIKLDGVEPMYLSNA